MDKDDDKFKTALNTSKIDMKNKDGVLKGVTETIETMMRASSLWMMRASGNLVNDQNVKIKVSEFDKDQEDQYIKEYMKTAITKEALEGLTDKATKATDPDTISYENWQKLFKQNLNLRAILFRQSQNKGRKEINLKKIVTDSTTA